MRIDGRFALDAPRAQVFAAITDPALMAGCIPGCESIAPLDARRYRAVVAVGVGSIHARFNLVVELTDERPPELVLSRTRGEEGSNASMIAADNSVRLVALDDTHTEVEYASEVSVTGRLGKFALGVMKKKVEALGAEFALRFRSALAARIAATQPDEPSHDRAAPAPALR